MYRHWPFIDLGIISCFYFSSIQMSIKSSVALPVERLILTFTLKSTSTLWKHIGPSDVLCGPSCHIFSCLCCFVVVCYRSVSYSQCCLCLWIIHSCSPLPFSPSCIIIADECMCALYRLLMNICATSDIDSVLTLFCIFLRLFCWILESLVRWYIYFTYFFPILL